MNNLYYTYSRDWLTSNLLNPLAMTINKDNSRRNFVRDASLAAAGFMIVPRHVLGRGFVAPSDKLNIAGIGAGGKGESDLLEFSKSHNVNIVALAAVDDRQA